MKVLIALSVHLLSVLLVSAHGGHEDSEESAKLANADYAIRHMATEHHIDSFDMESFFQLHDLNRDGVWDREEIEAIYGVHHVYSQKKSKDEIEHQKKADQVADTVLKLLDKDGDGKVTPEEFTAVGLSGLPSFDDIGAEGHHYDVESEFFLHHEEQYHSTPETQTDASYTHPEDLEHFSQHAAIEREEAEREAIFQGITVEEAIRAHEEPPARPVSPAESAPKPKITRGVPPEKQDPVVKYKDIGKESDSQSEWGTGEQGYKQPNTPAEKTRKNLPYKERIQYKFRRNWGDF
ncbi:precursor to secretory protein Ssp120 [Suillus hirtellus]|nr:precursor to secretory protein Ssp120 [Suillus hirtellus]